MKDRISKSVSQTLFVSVLSACAFCLVACGPSKQKTEGEGSTSKKAVDENQAKTKRELCDEKDGEACFDIGLDAKMERFNTGGEYDRKKARKYFQKSCELGIDEGCLNAGELMYAGEGGPEDKKSARDYFKRGCDSDILLSCFRYGQMLDKGEAGPENKEEAHALYEKSCTEDLRVGCAALEAEKETDVNTDSDSDSE